MENHRLSRAMSLVSIPYQRAAPREARSAKRGTLLKVRHDGTALLIHSFSSHISQGMGCATVATASAGTAGTGTLAKSGWEKNTEANREQDTGFRELRPGCPV